MFTPQTVINSKIKLTIDKIDRIPLIIQRVQMPLCYKV